MTKLSYRTIYPALFYKKCNNLSLHNTFHSKESILHAMKLILRYKALKISNEMPLYSFGRIVKALKMAPKEKVWHSHSERKMQRRFNCGKALKAPKQQSGDGEGQGSLVCCSPWGLKELDMTE